jgi:glycosyltransferase involved in cell wall biosynthesis
VVRVAWQFSEQPEQIIMNGKVQQVLFVSHKANRSGAPMVLLGIIRELKKQSALRIMVILMEDGPLAVEFRQLATTFLWAPRSIRIPGLPDRNIIASFISRLITIGNGLWILFRIRKSGIVFLNTITNGHMHRKLLFLKAKIITYVHELEISIHALTNKKALDVVLQHTDLFLACSVAVKSNLVLNHQVAREKIEVVYSSIPEIKREKELYRHDLDVLKVELNIPADAIVFGAVGENEWRKGFDLFSPLICLYFNLYPDSTAHFVWMGIRKERWSYFDDMIDFNKYEIRSKTHFIEHSADYLRNMSLFDVHLLLSREDPFPLVVMDAASFGIPTICFLDGGGAPELIEDGAGICVPYGDLFRMAGAIHDMELDKLKRSHLGKNALERLKKGYNLADATTMIINLMHK